MGDKEKRLCKWKKDEYEERFRELSELVGEARFICVRCGRAAVSRKSLCKPRKI